MVQHAFYQCLQVLQRTDHLRRLAASFDDVPGSGLGPAAGAQVRQRDQLNQMVRAAFSGTDDAESAGRTRLRVDVFQTTLSLFCNVARAPEGVQLLLDCGALHALVSRSAQLPGLLPARTLLQQSSGAADHHREVHAALSDPKGSVSAVLTLLRTVCASNPFPPVLEVAASFVQQQSRVLIALLDDHPGAQMQSLRALERTEAAAALVALLAAAPSAVADRLCWCASRGGSSTGVPLVPPLRRLLQCFSEPMPTAESKRRPLSFRAAVQVCVCQSVCLSVCLSVSLSVCLSFRLFACPSGRRERSVSVQ
jgi:hypothetical protein